MPGYLNLLGDFGRSNIGSDGDDIIRGQNGIDFFSGGQGDDVLLGQGGNDNLNGGNGNDNLTGGIGNDTLEGGAGNDTLNGSVGHDILRGGADNDVLDGGSGLDLYQYDITGGMVQAFGHDTIIDADRTGSIQLVDTGSGAVTTLAGEATYNATLDVWEKDGFTFKADGHDLLIELDANNSIRLKDFREDTDGDGDVDNDDDGGHHASDELGVSLEDPTGQMASGDGLAGDGFLNILPNCPVNSPLSGNTEPKMMEWGCTQPFNLGRNLIF